MDFPMSRPGRADPSIRNRCAALLRPRAMSSISDDASEQSDIQIVVGNELPVGQAHVQINQGLRRADGVVVATAWKWSEPAGDIPLREVIENAGTRMDR
jgi:hypothetical protein